MFVKDPEEKNKEDEKIIKEMIKDYKQKREKEKTENNSKKKAGNKIGFDGWSGGTTDLLLKCFSPVAIVASAGVLAKVAGFVVNEISKISPITSSLHLSTAITDIIMTKEFWLAVASVAAICAVVFVVASIVKAIANVISIESQGKQKIRSKNIEKGAGKNTEISKDRRQLKETYEDNDQEEEISSQGCKKNNFDCYNGEEISNSVYTNNNYYNKITTFQQQNNSKKKTKKCRNMQ